MPPGTFRSRQRRSCCQSTRRWLLRRRTPATRPMRDCSKSSMKVWDASPTPSIARGLGSGRSFCFFPITADWSMSRMGASSRRIDRSAARRGRYTKGAFAFPRLPGTVPAISTCDTPAITIDIYPTLLELASAKALTNQPLDGVSLASMLKNPAATPNRDTLYWHLPHYHPSTPARAIRRCDWKLIEFFETGSLELYILATDLGEQTILVTDEPQRAKEMQ